MLYSNSVLVILDTVLRSNDINMVEESLPTFEAWCKHANTAALSADQQRTQQYMQLVEQYASFADPVNTVKTRSTESISLNLRWRTAGLRAIRAAVASDALSTESAKQLNTVMPVILQNMGLDKADVLSSLQQRARLNEKQENDFVRRRRLSSATITTVDTTDRQLTASETAADADKASEDEVKVLAVRCLKQIFSVGTSSIRGYTRLATALTIKYIASQRSPKSAVPTNPQGNWATALFETIARWTPVQDRFIIVITAMETLVRSPVVEATLDKQLVLASMIDWLLSSDINLIGLSIMDVMLGFVQYTLVLLQLGDRHASITLQMPQNDTLGFIREAKETLDPANVLSEKERGREKSTTESTASPARQELLQYLQRCIASLSNHIYYTEQISDMLAAILARLKPSANADAAATAAAIEKPAAATKAIADSASIQEDPTTDSFFSFATARTTALTTVKDILMRASHKRNSAGTAVGSRARVGVYVWEGTQWLLKDDDPEVRVAYVDAILTWLRLETGKNDTLLPRDGPRKGKSGKKTTTPDGETNMTKRAVSNASRKESKPARSTFVQLLHLAAYDSIIDRSHNESDILMLYLLLTKLVERLGVNALRTGLPMILKLQEAVLNSEIELSTSAKINIASLVQGYLWSVAEKFEFETTRVGHEINAEISRRKRFNVWFDKIKFPALSLHSIVSQAAGEPKDAVYAEEAADTLKPFLNVTDLVEEIANAYDTALLSPQQSPPSSPGRVFSVPALGFGYGYGVAPGPKPSPKDQLPQRVKEEMGATWTRELCMASVEKESTGSVAGTSGPRHHLSVVSVNKNETGDNQDHSPGHGLSSGLGSLQKIRKGSPNGSPIPLGSTSSRDSTLRVTELKRVLSASGHQRQASPLRRPLSSRRSTMSAGSDSMVSWNEADDGERDAGDPNVSAFTTNGVQRTSRPSTSNSKATKGHQRSSSQNSDAVPPVPKIPSNLNLPGTFPRDSSPARNRQSSQTLSSQVGDVPSDGTRPNHTVESSQTTSSLRAGTKRSSRPASRQTANAAFWKGDARGQATEKINVSNLLAGIRPSTSSGSFLTTSEPGAAGPAADEGGSTQPRGLLVVEKPPY
jgi:protein EFR3